MDQAGPDRGYEWRACMALALKRSSRVHCAQVFMDRDSCAGLAATLGGAPELVHLQIAGCALGASDTSELFSSMRTCTALEHLDLSSNGLGVFSARNLTHVLSACRELQTLKLAANALYGVALMVLARCGAGYRVGRGCGMPGLCAHATL